MPELPEVEVSRRGLEPLIAGQMVRGAVVRVPRLRHEIPPDLPRRLAGRTLRAIDRRGKYLLFDFGDGWLILHLGMSGSLRLVPPGTPPQKHDHFDLEFAGTTMRLRDPRRFGTLVWTEEAPERHPLLALLGIEPLSPGFDGRWLHAAAIPSGNIPLRVRAMKLTFVGVGNIYASESLFRAGISPLRAANRISRARYELLLPAIRETLSDAIAAGGSSIRDYVHSDGGAGCFQIQAGVYDRAGEPCLRCGGTVKQIRQAGRSTYYCPACQH